MNGKVKLIAVLLLSACMEIPVYICLHEAGHALIAIACGAEILSFSIVGAYVSSMGGNFTRVTSSLMNIAGMALPLIFAVCYMLFIFNKNKQGYFYRIFSLFFVIAPVGSLMTWVFIPVAYLAGDTTSPDDVIHFLNSSGIHPAIVMSGALVMLVWTGFLAWKKGIVQIWLELVMQNKKLS